MDSSGGGAMNEPAAVTRVVVTGGPCAGKTTVVGLLRGRLAASGVPAVFVGEAATDLILSGVTPESCGSALAFQTRVIALQIEREAAALGEAGRMAGRPVVVCDRGVCDSRAYLDEGGYALALEASGLAPGEALARYDHVIHLQTAAKAGEGLYDRGSNAARVEDAREAVLADGRTLAAWAGHPDVALIEADESFERKAEDVFRAVMRAAAPGR